MSEKTLFKKLAALAGFPLKAGLMAAVEMDALRHTHSGLAARMATANTMMIVGALLYLATLVAIVLAVTGTFGFSHAAEIVGFASPGLSDRHPGLTAFINSVTATWIALTLNLACCEAAKRKIRRSDELVDRHNQAQAQAQAKRTARTTEMAEELEAAVRKSLLPVIQLASLDAALQHAESLIKGYLANPEVSAHIDVAVAERVRDQLRKARSDMLSALKESENAQ